MNRRRSVLEASLPCSDGRDSDRSRDYVLNKLRRRTTSYQHIPALLLIPIMTLIPLTSLRIDYNPIIPSTDLFIHRNSKPRIVQMRMDIYTTTILDCGFKNSTTPRLSWDSDDSSTVYQSQTIHPLKEGCHFIADWQSSYHPTCNDIHQFEIQLLNFINNGGFRDVWKIQEYTKEYRALKTLRYIEKRDFDLLNFDRHRRDAVAFDQLSYSPYVADIYGNCANSALFDYMDGGTLFDFMAEQQEPSSRELLQIAHDVTMSVVHAHNVDERGRPTIAHTDIKPDQWIRDSNGTFRLVDFNRARFLGWNSTAEETCAFLVGKNSGPWRSPEELNYKDETEKVDVWSLGNILYFILTKGKTPNSGMVKIDAKDSVKRGKWPHVNDTYLQKSDDPFVQIMVEAIELCFVVDPKQRATARAVADVMKRGLNLVEPTRETFFSSY